MLDAMRRGYTRESYLSLIEQVRAKLPNATISSDFISGFCGENEADHQQTLSLLREVRFDRAFMFAYSLREKTHAHRLLKDDVPEHIKQRRLQEVVELFNAGARAANEEEESRTKPPLSLVVFLPLLPLLPFLSFVTPHSSHLSHATFFLFVTRHFFFQVGREHLVMVDSLSKRSEEEWAGKSNTAHFPLISHPIFPIYCRHVFFAGRTDNNKRVVFARRPVVMNGSSQQSQLQPGDYVAVRITQASLILMLPI